MKEKAAFLVSILTIPLLDIPAVSACGYCKPAKQALESRNYKRAAVILDKAEQAHSRCPEMALVKTEALMLQDKNYQALDEINRALKASPNNARLWLTRAEVHEKLKNPKMVIEDATRAIKYDRKLEKAYLIRAKAYYNLTYFMLSKNPQNREKGIKDLDTAMRLNPKNPVAYEYKGVWLMANEKYTEAIDPLTRGLALNPRDKKLLSYRSMAYSETSQYEKSIKDLTTFIEVEPTSPDGWKKRGNLYVQTNKYKAALHDYDQAMKISPADYRLKYRHASVCMKLKQYKRAIADYLAIIQRNPLDDDAVKSLGDAYFAASDYPNSIKYYSEAIDLSPLSAYYAARAKAYQKAGKSALAGKDLQKAKQLKNEPAVKKI